MGCSSVYGGGNYQFRKSSVDILDFHFELFRSPDLIHNSDGVPLLYRYCGDSVSFAIGALNACNKISKLFSNPRAK